MKCNTIASNLSTWTENQSQSIFKISLEIWYDLEIRKYTKCLTNFFPKKEKEKKSKHSADKYDAKYLNSATITPLSVLVKINYRKWKEESDDEPTNWNGYWK